MDRVHGGMLICIELQREGRAIWMSAWPWWAASLPGENYILGRHPACPRARGQGGVEAAEHGRSGMALRKRLRATSISAVSGGEGSLRIAIRR